MPLNKRSQLITQGVQRSPNRAMLRAVGFKDADFKKPIIGIANGYSTITPCNLGLGDLTRRAEAAAKREIVMIAVSLYDSMSAQMLCRQPSARWATEMLWAGVSFCSIWTTLPFSILYELTTAMASRSDRKSTRLNSSHWHVSRMPSSA